MTQTPMYRKVYSSIKKDIKDGKYRPGTLIPTETQLEEQFSVSRITIRRAISMLVRDGYLKVQQGKGTMVLDPSTTQRLNCVTSLTETLISKGYEVETIGMSIELQKPSKAIANILGIKENANVYFIQRLQMADGAPVAIMTNYVEEKWAPGLEQYQDKFVGLYSLLESKYHIIIDSADERITAIGANFTEAQILQVPIGTPLLLSKRLTYTHNGILEYSILKIIADKYEYSVHLQGRIL